LGGPGRGGAFIGVVVGEFKQVEAHLLGWRPEYQKR
jgi:hypothetical protein